MSSAGKSATPRANKQEETRRRRIIMDGDSSSDEEEDVISIHSSSSGSSSSSSGFEDFDTMWDKHVLASKQQQEELATQPPSRETTNNNKQRQDTPTVPKTISTNNKMDTTPESLEMSSSTTVSEKHAKRAPKVSLSPQQTKQKLVPGSNVTMLEAVVTQAAAAANARKEANEKEVKVEQKQTSSNGMQKQTSKLAADNRGISKDTVINNPKSLVTKKSTDKGKKSRVKQDSSVLEEVNTALSEKKEEKKAASDKVKSTNKPEKRKTPPTTTDAKKDKSTKKKKTKKDGTKQSLETVKSTANGNKPKDSSLSKSSKSQAKMSSSSEKKKKKPTKQVVKPESKSEKVKTSASDKPASNTTTGKRKTPPSTTESTTTATSTAAKSPPPKKKKKRTFQDEILSKMLLSCKPFTLKSLAHSLDSTEAAIHHVMLSLVDKKIVVKKEFSSKSGRTKDLYWANQESTAKQVQALELPTMEEMTTVQEDFASFRAKDTFIARELYAVQQEPSNEELDKQLAEMENAVRVANTKLQETKDRIAGASKQGGSKGTVHNPLIFKKRINNMRDEWKKRKTKCMDFVDQLADGMEKPIKAIVKLLDLETDEMEGVTMPPKYDVK